MLLLLHIILTYIKENIITKLQRLYSPPRNARMGNKSPALLVKKPLSTGDLSTACKIFIERPDGLCRVSELVFKNKFYSGIFPSTFVPLAEGSKNSISI